MLTPEEIDEIARITREAGIQRERMVRWLQGFTCKKSLDRSIERQGLLRCRRSKAKEG
jgi:hypothetical protein